jgi:HAD superfamily hydrolase (TIGR01484 family)
MNRFDATEEEPVLDAAPAADRPILATDLDGTLIPLDGRPENRRALQQLVAARLQDRFTLVFVTGRHKASICEVICEQHLPLPDWVISDVGTTIYRAETPFRLDPVERYQAHLAELTGGRPIEALDELVLAFESTRVQEAEKQGPFKRSYYADAEAVPTIAEGIRERLAVESLPYAVIDSVDPFNGDGLIDLLPQNVSKAYALQWWSDHIDRPREAVVFAGDSGNDLAAFTAGYRAIVVGNTDRQIAAQAAAAHRERAWHDRLLLAEGYATSGVLEGCRHFGLIDAEDAFPAEDESPADDQSPAD